MQPSASLSPQFVEGPDPSGVGEPMAEGSGLSSASRCCITGSGCAGRDVEAKA